MNVSTAPAPFQSASSGNAVSGNPPVLGSQVLGKTGGMPEQRGLSALSNPMANKLQSMGRGNDSMLVHMTPGEVQSLQGLASAAGGSLTINPKTGLPEAGFLENILPALLGAGLAFIPGVGPLAAAGIVGAGSTAITGDISKGLMAGLGAFGGASLAGALAPAAAGAGAASGAASSAIPQTIVADQLATQTATLGTGAAAAGAGTAGAGVAGAGAAGVGAAGAAKTGLPGVLQRFGQQASAGLGTGIAAKAAPFVAGAGLLNTANAAFSPQTKMPEEEKSNYNGPYRYEPRQVLNPGSSPIETRDSSEKLYFAPQQPRLIDASGNPVGGFGPGPAPMPMAPSGGLPGAFAMNMIRRKNQEDVSPFSRPIWDTFAKGGEVNMRDGSFVVDARTVSELGNGSSEAGQELLARMGGKPIKGPGDGVSDSIPAKIEGKQPARVARDEVVFSPEAVRRVGGGDEKKGAQKLYALMERAHKARRQSARGKDTKLRRGLA